MTIGLVDTFDGVANSSLSHCSWISSAKWGGLMGSMAWPKLSGGGLCQIKSPLLIPSKYTLYVTNLFSLDCSKSFQIDLMLSMVKLESVGDSINIGLRRTPESFDGDSSENSLLIFRYVKTLSGFGVSLGSGQPQSFGEVPGRLSIYGGGGVLSFIVWNTEGLQFVAGTSTLLGNVRFNPYFGITVTSALDDNSECNLSEFRISTNAATYGSGDGFPIPVDCGGEVPVPEAVGHREFMRWPKTGGSNYSKLYSSGGKCPICGNLNGIQSWPTIRNEFNQLCSCDRCTVIYIDTDAFFLPKVKPASGGSGGLNGSIGDVGWVYGWWRINFFKTPPAAPTMVFSKISVDPVVLNESFRICVRVTLDLDDRFIKMRWVVEEDSDIIFESFDFSPEITLNRASVYNISATVYSLFGSYTLLVKTLTIS